MKIRQIRKQYPKWKKKANALQSWVLENFQEEILYKRFADFVYKEEKFDVENWLDSLNAEEHT